MLQDDFDELSATLFLLPSQTSALLLKRYKTSWFLHLRETPV
jgi:hypothetical protein